LTPIVEIVIIVELIKQMEKKMKFNKIESFNFTAEFQRDYLVWERNDNSNIVITKMRGTSDYVVENLNTCERFDTNSLNTAKEVGYLF